MSYFKIKGGTPLIGEVMVRGAKNASYKQIIASLLTSEKVELLNIPKIDDVAITKGIVKALGGEIKETGPHSLEILAENIGSEIPSGVGEKSRASHMFIGPLLARTGRIVFPEPGGDKLGTRPMDRVFEFLRQMGARVEESDNFIEIKCQKLIGVDYRFFKPSHTGTEILIMCAVLAKGKTIIRNAAREPEIDDLIEMLTKMGAKIARDKNDFSIINIDGVETLSGCTHQVIADRNEAVTFACAALVTRGSVDIMRIKPEIVETFLKTIEKMGAEVTRGWDEVHIGWVDTLKAVDIETEPEPGFMTDWQAVFSLLLSQARGVSSVVERIFPNRMHHIPLLNKMGVKTSFFNPKISDENFDNYYHFNKESNRPEYFHGVKIYGPAKLKPVDIEIADLRAGATAVLAALATNGESKISGVEYVERGYEKLAERLVAMGAKIEVVKI